jgi:hypothetical protein
MTARPTFNEPSRAVAIDGQVVVEGPGGVGHAFTPAAARETGARLATAADQAEAQIAPSGEDAHKGSSVGEVTP